jgi:hypothetical protein
MIMNAVHCDAAAVVVDDENDTEGCLLEFGTVAADGTTMAPAAARAAWHRSDNARVLDYCIAAPLLLVTVAAEIVVEVVLKEHGAWLAKAPPPGSSELDADAAELQLQRNGRQRQEKAPPLQKAGA